MAMSNAERQKLWRQRHPGERRGEPQVRMSGTRVDLMLEEAMNADLRAYVDELLRANEELGAALDAARSENEALRRVNSELRRVNAELIGKLQAAQAPPVRVAPIPTRKRQQQTGRFADD